MPALSIPDIEPFIANDRVGVRYYLSFSWLLIIFGLLVLSSPLVPAIRPVNGLHDVVQMIGGFFISIASAVPLKEYLARRDRLRILIALNERIKTLALQASPAQEELNRISDLVWEIYKKGAGA